MNKRLYFNGTILNERSLTRIGTTRTYTTEASALRWSPGWWPGVIELRTEDGEYHVLYKSRVESGARVYCHAVAPDVAVHVFND